MRKRDEFEKLDSCLNRALPDELLFIILGRDIAAPATVRFWASERVRLRKNKWSDAKIIEALEWASEVAGDGSSKTSN